MQIDWHTVKILIRLIRLFLDYSSLLGLQIQMLWMIMVSVNGHMHNGISTCIVHDEIIKF